MWLTGVCQCDWQVCVNVIDRSRYLLYTSWCVICIILVETVNDCTLVSYVLVIFRSWGTHTWFYEHIKLVRGTRTSFPFSVIIKGKTKTFVSLLFALIFERSRTPDDGKHLLHDSTSCYTSTTSHWRTSCGQHVMWQIIMWPARHVTEQVVPRVQTSRYMNAVLRARLQYVYLWGPHFVNIWQYPG